MLGMSSTEWSRYMHDELGVPVPPEGISSEVADRLVQQYRERLPLLPGAVEAVKSLARQWPLGLASSSNRNVIDLVLEGAGLVGDFKATVSSEEVRARQAGAGRLPGGDAAARGRSGRLRRGRGLDQRHPLRARRGDGGDSGPQRGLPAGAGRSGAGGARARLAGGAQPGAGTRRSLPLDLVGQADHPTGEGPSAEQLHRATGEPVVEERFALAEDDRDDRHLHPVEQAMVGELRRDVAAPDNPDVTLAGGGSASRRSVRRLGVGDADVDVIPLRPLELARAQHPGGLAGVGPGVSMSQHPFVGH